MIGPSIESFVEGRLVATHREPFGEVPHAHVWDVRVSFWTQDARPIDARVRIVELDRALAELGFDLAVTLGERATNEGLAVWLLSRLSLLDAAAVEVRRGPERCGAIARSRS